MCALCRLQLCGLDLSLSFFLHLPHCPSLPPQSTYQTSFTFLISLPSLLSAPSNVLSAAGIFPSYYHCYSTHPSSAPVPALISIAGHSHSGSLLARATKPQINHLLPDTGILVTGPLKLEEPSDTTESVLFTTPENLVDTDL